MVRHFFVPESLLKLLSIGPVVIQLSFKDNKKYHNIKF